MPCTDQPHDTYVSVSHWVQEVAQYTIQGKGVTSSHGMKLRSVSSCKPNRRPALAEASTNPRRYVYVQRAEATTGRKRKRPMENAKQEKRGRGRPPGVRKPLNQNPSDTSLPLLGKPTPDTPSAFSRSGASSEVRRKSASPRKNAKFLDQPKVSAGVDLQYLETCSPRVKQMSIQNVRAVYGQLPASVTHLYQKLNAIPHGVIPSELRGLSRQEAQTPRKSRDPPRNSDYLEDNTTPYPPTHLNSLKARVDQTLRDAMWNHRSKAHEKQWGRMINQLLGDFVLWPNDAGFKILNAETCAVEPMDIRVIMPNGTPLDIETATTSSRPSAGEESTQTLTRMVDWCLGLDLDHETQGMISKAFETVRANEQSLNQTLSYLRNVPLFLDIEIKKTQSIRDPEVQLAIWASGALRKRQLHSWDTSMPMPAIAVSGHSWDYYLFFQMETDLIMVGPVPMGTTGDLNGIYRIVYHLHTLIQWGTHEYKTWFDENVLYWCQERASISDREERSRTRWNNEGTRMTEYYDVSQ